MLKKFPEMRNDNKSVNGKTKKQTVCVPGNRTTTINDSKLEVGCMYTQSVEIIAI